MAPPSSAHVQLDDVPQTPIQPSFEGEFRQHDGVVTMMIFYRRRASPKHRYDRGAPHTAKRSKGSIVVVSRGAPLPPYIKEQGGRRPTKEEGAPRGESYSHRE